MENKFKTNPNDAAFARPVGGTLEDGNGDTLGLTKREYFAAIAMNGHCSHKKLALENDSDIARWSVKIADALIEELNKEKSVNPDQML